MKSVAILFVVAGICSTGLGWDGSGEQEEVESAPTGSNWPLEGAPDEEFTPAQNFKKLLDRLTAALPAVDANPPPFADNIAALPAFIADALAAAGARSTPASEIYPGGDDAELNRILENIRKRKRFPSIINL